MRERLGAGCWAGCLQFFVVEAVTALRAAGHYSYRNNYISDLGAAGCAHGCSPWHALMNLSFFVQGVLIGAGTLLLPRRFSPGWLGGVARSALMLAALGLIAVSVAPEDVDMNLHISGARTHFLAGTIGMLFWGLSVVRGGHRASGARAALIAFAAAAFADLLLVFESGPVSMTLGGGVLERLAAYPLPLWLAWTGWSLLGKRLRERRDL